MWLHRWRIGKRGRERARVLTLTARPASVARRSCPGGGISALAACGGQSPGTALSAVSCSVPRLNALSSPTPTPAAKSLGVAVPVWSGAIGRPSTVVGDTSLWDWTRRAVAPLAFDVATGRLGWTVAPPADHPNLFDIVADATTVVAAIGHDVGQPPGLVSPLINGLAAYDSATGRERWSVTIPDDGQKIPALLTGSTVVVSEEDGTLLGLNEQTGHQLWRDRATAGLP